MEYHLKNRPNKTIFPLNTQISLREKAVAKIKEDFLPNGKIEKIILIGSSVKGTFGEYEKPGFRGSIFSDFDFIFIVDEKYLIPEWLTKEPDGKPFPYDEMNLAYRQKAYIEGKYDAEIFFIHTKNTYNSQIQDLAEKAGIPLRENSTIKHMVIYSK